MKVEYADSKSNSDVSKIVINQADQHNFSFDISRNDNIFSVDAKILYQQQNYGEDDHDIINNDEEGDKMTTRQLTPAHNYTNSLQSTINNHINCDMAPLITTSDN